MKGNFSLIGSLFLMIGSCLWFSCSESQDSGTTSPDRGSGFPLDQIKRTFARDYAAAPMTRGGSESDRTDLLAPGYIRPDWDSVMLYYGENLFQAHTAFDAQYEYFVFRLNKSDSLLYPMPKRLVVLKDPETEEQASYLRFLIPDTGSDGPDAGAGFSGLVLYTTLSGVPVAVGRYEDGELSDSASVLDDPAVNREQLEKMLGSTEDIYVARVLAGPNLQEPGNPIDPVEIIGNKDPNIVYVNVNLLLNKIVDFGGADMPGIKPPLGDIDLGFGSGGGNGGDSDLGFGFPFAGKTYSANRRIKYDAERVKLILDSLNRDCMGQLLINAIEWDVSITSGHRGACVTSAYTTYSKNERYSIRYEIKMGDRFDRITMMEELMHIYQGLGTPGFSKEAKLNYEVEAKLTWYIYCIKNNHTENFSSSLGGPQGPDMFDKMRVYVFNGDVNHPEFIEAFDDAARCLRNIPIYRNEKNYPYDPGKMDCENLIKLLKQCNK